MPLVSSTEPGASVAQGRSLYLPALERGSSRPSCPLWTAHPHRGAVFPVCVVRFIHPYGNMMEDLDELKMVDDSDSVESNQGDDMDDEAVCFYKLIPPRSTDAMKRAVRTEKTPQDN